MMKREGPSSAFMQATGQDMTEYSPHGYFFVVVEYRRVFLRVRAGSKVTSTLLHRRAQAAFFFFTSNDRCPARRGSSEKQKQGAPTKNITPRRLMLKMSENKTLYL